MACVDSDNFSASDLCLFIESIEKITRIERQKQERILQYRAQYLAETLRYLDQQYPASSSSTLSSTDDPAEESILENVEEKEILHYAVNDIIYNSTYDEDQHMGYDSTDVMLHEYCQIDSDYDDTVYEDQSWLTTIYSRHFLASTKISEPPASFISSSGIYEQIPSKLAESIASGSYAEPRECMQSTQISTAPGIYEQIPDGKSKTAVSFSSNTYEEPKTKKKSLKRCLLGLVCKKYRKGLSNNTKNWCKSKSWMKLTAV